LVRKVLDGSIRIDGNERGGSGSQKVRIAFDGIPERDETAGGPPNPTPDVQEVIVIRRCAVPDRRVHHWQPDSGLFEFPIVDAKGAHVIGTRLLTPNEIVGMMGDAHLIGFGVPHADFYGRDVLGHGRRLSLGFKLLDLA